MTSTVHCQNFIYNSDFYILIVATFRSKNIKIINRTMSYPNVNRLTREQCEQFIANPTLNPLTGRIINPRGNIGRAIQAHCDAMLAPLTVEQCTRFLRNPTHHPLTNEPIEQNSEMFRILSQRCQEIIQWERSNRSTARASSRSRRPLTREECDQLRANPSINPATSNRINPHGATAIQLLQQCDRDHPLSNARTPMDNALCTICEEVRNNPRINPQTGLPMSNGESMDILETCNMTCPPDFLPLNNRRLSNIDVAKFLHKHGRARDNQQSIFRSQLVRSQEELEEFLKKVDLYYPRFWIRYYINAGRSKRQFKYYGLHQLAEIQRLMANSSSASNSVPSHKSNSLLSDEHLTEKCINIFHGVHEDNPFRRNANKIIRICNEFNACQDARVSTIQQTIKRRYNEMKRSIVVHIAEPEKSFSTVFNSSKENIDSIAAFFRRNNWVIHVEGHEGIGEGVIRNFIQNCMKQISNNPRSSNPDERVKFFTPLYAGSNRYVINPNISVEQARRLGFDIQTEDDLCRIYKCIGQLFAYCARFGYPIPIYLPRAMLAHILYKQTDITPEMYVFYEILDGDPQVRNSILDLIRNPEHIEMSGLYDDLMLLDSHNETEVTPDNFIEYISRKHKHTVMQQLEKGSPNTKKYLDALMSGIYIRKGLQLEKVTVRELDKLMFGLEISYNNVREWVRRTGRIDYIEPSTDYQRNVLTWFQEILNELGATIPVDQVPVEDDDVEEELSGSASTKNKKRAFVRFFARLMQFWTGYRKIDTTIIHQVRFERPTGLPTAHTCFNQLCLPGDIVSKEDLYNKLIDAVYNVEMAIGMLGGNQ